MEKHAIQPSEFANKNLVSVEIEESIISIGHDAFRNNKIKELIIPDNVERIEFQAFSENAIEKLKLSARLEIIEKSVFSDNKIKKLDIPERVKIIERTAFQRNKITELIIPETVREIWTGAFWQNKITKITIGPHVNIIKGEYDETQPEGTFGDYGASFLKLYESNGFLGGKYTYNSKMNTWDFVEIPLRANSSIRIWSDETRKYTEETLKNLEFGVNPITKNVSMKREDGSFGYIEIKDALNNNYTVVSEGGRIEYFRNVYDLTRAGWALD